VVLRRGRRHARAPRRLAQAEPVDPALRDHRLGRYEERLAEGTVVVTVAPAAGLDSV
jgi:hypothetical protein